MAPFDTDLLVAIKVITLGCIKTPPSLKICDQTLRSQERVQSELTLYNSD